MAELSVTLADVSMTFGRTVMAEVSTAHGRSVIWPNCLSTNNNIVYKFIKHYIRKLPSDICLTPVNNVTFNKCSSMRNIYDSIHYFFHYLKKAKRWKKGGNIFSIVCCNSI